MKLRYIFTLAVCAANLLSCSKEPKVATVPLDLFLVIDHPKVGFQPIVVKQLDLKGYSTEQPGFRMDKIESVYLMPPHPVTIVNPDHTTGKTVKCNKYEVSVRLLPKDHIEFSKFTASCIGGTVLMKVKDEPIFAVPFNSSIPNGQFVITLDSEEQANRVERHLQTLK